MGLATSLASGNVWRPEIRMANPPPSLLAKYTQKEKAFFSDYASFVLRVTGDAIVLERLRRIFAIESVRIEKAVDIRVMVFPARPPSGRTSRMLHGSYNDSLSQISLYPLKLPREWIRQNGFDLFKQPYHGLSQTKKQLLYKISQTAIATLLHEILHVKFEGGAMTRYAEESIVRKLETKYMLGWDETISTVAERALGRSTPN